MILSKTLTTLFAGGALLLGAGLCAADITTTSMPASGPASDPARQFDFWVGEWDVYDRNGDPAGKNDISLVSGGEVLLEEWVNPRGGRGTSLSYFQANDQSWNQVWVTRQEGASLAKGGLVDGEMILVNEENGVVTGRTTWTPNDDGTVRQHWQMTPDGGETWQTRVDLVYERRSTDETDANGED